MSVDDYNPYQVSDEWADDPAPNESAPSDDYDRPYDWSEQVYNNTVVDNRLDPAGIGNAQGADQWGRVTDNRYYGVPQKQAEPEPESDWQQFPQLSADGQWVMWYEKDQYGNVRGTGTEPQPYWENQGLSDPKLAANAAAAAALAARPTNPFRPQGSTGIPVAGGYGQLQYAIQAGHLGDARNRTAQAAQDQRRQALMGKAQTLTAYSNSILDNARATGRFDLYRWRFVQTQLANVLRQMA